MAINPLKAFLFLTGGAGAAVGGAYVTGLVDMLNAPVPGIEAKAPEQPESAALAPQPEPAAPAEPAKPAESGLALPPLTFSASSRMAPWSLPARRLRAVRSMW